MWVFLSSRLRTWLLLAVAVPFARKIVRALANRSKHQDAAPVKALRTADSALARVDRRERKRRKKLAKQDA